MKLIPCLLISFFYLNSPSFAQMFGGSSYLSDHNGSVLKPNKNTDGVQGNPYLTEDWCKGQIENRTGIKLDVEKLRFNIVQNRVEYEFNKQVYELSIPCIRFIIQLPSEDGRVGPHLFQSGFPAVDEQNGMTFYEVVYNGKCKLLKLHKVILSEYAEPLSVNRIKRMRKISVWYVFNPAKNKVIKFNKRTEDLGSIFDDKKVEMNEFIKRQKIRKKPTDTELEKICGFYDSIIEL
jgi:hypothetical protein